MMNFSVYTNTARFDNQARALTEDELFKLAPSIFAVDKHDSRSDRFQPIPTIEVVRGLAKEGFSVVGARQSKSRDESRRDFTKHLLRIRKIDHEANLQVGDTVFEMIMKNANDGTAAYDLMAGLFRIRCTNSLVSQVGSLDSTKVRHGGTAEGVIGKVIDGTFRVMQTAETLMAAPQDWGRAVMNPDEKLILARAAHIVRFGDEPAASAEAIQPSQFLLPKRSDDRANDLWTTFNVVQENTIKGGLHGRYRDADNRLRNTSTRQIKGIDQDVKLNKALWLLGEEMARLKGVAIAA